MNLTIPSYILYPTIPGNKMRYIIFLSCTDCDCLFRFKNAVPTEEENCSYRSQEQVTLKFAPSYHMNVLITCRLESWYTKLV